MSHIQDGGHGGTDPGAVAFGNIEKIYTLEASLYVDKRLKEHGIKSTVTRTRDVGLTQFERTDLVKKSGAEFCLSHHFNAGGGDGFECIHSIHSDGKFERMMAEEFKKAGYPLRRTPVFTRTGSGGRDFYFMHRLTGAVKTTIIEYDFVDGPQRDKIKSKEYRVGMYEAVIRSVCRFNGVKYKPVAKEPEKPKNATEAKQATFYRVVTGSFANRANCDRRIADLRNKKFDSFLEVFKKDGKTFFRCVTGSFADRSNAERRVKALKDSGFDSFIEVFKK